MIADGSSLPSLKRKRLPAVDSLDTQAAAAKVRLAIKKSSGEIFVCLRRFLRHQIKCPRVVIRVRFPDKHTLEVAFHSAEKIQSLFDLLKKVVARPELPFYICKQGKGQSFICL
ncbi:hypothetical protein DKX38_025322 [Salix brachista]|uniref:UBX domain-containing protein n=1 Tax=Salix brachista TaxID=2182728 RepID=A0A5N5JU62_9ROSI|nr:hypothetical protein DKX38_025322 [Salix brachista]